MKMRIYAHLDLDLQTSVAHYPRDVVEGERIKHGGPVEEEDGVRGDLAG